MCNVTWITHLAMMDVREHFRLPFMPSGGWLETYKEQLTGVPHISFSIICVEKAKKEAVLRFEKGGIKYYLINAKEESYYGKFSSCFVKNLNGVLAETKPDIIHLHGTEFAISLALQQEWYAKTPICISIQGLISVISSRYFWGGLDRRQMLFRESLPIAIQQCKAKQRGEKEKRILALNKYFIGRTAWDYAHLKAMNRQAVYYHLAEPIRREFIDGQQWSLDGALPHSIFCAGGCRIPIKGFHKILEALELIIDKYPDATLYVTGSSPMTENSLKTKIGYRHYIRRILEEKNLFSHVVFTGTLNASQMVEYFAKSRCYIMASCIENSPNTLLEAMYVGTPVICALAGGIQDFVSHNVNALIYRFEEVEMLATYISSLFDDDELCCSLSAQAKRAVAEKQKGESLDDIYQDIMKRFASKS